MTTRETPITEFVFWPAERNAPYELPELTRATTLYGTPTTIRVRVNHKMATRPQLTFNTEAREHTQRKEGLYCMPDEATWDLFLDELATLQDALSALKAEVATLPLYHTRRDALERTGVKSNPICRSGIRVWPIGKRIYSQWEPWAITDIRRERIAGHSMHNIRLVGSSNSMANSIYDWHCCLTEADWKRTKAAHDLAKAAYAVVAARIKTLGKYNEAVKDQRYRGQQRVSAPVNVGMFATNGLAKKKRKLPAQKVA